MLPVIQAGPLAVPLPRLLLLLGLWLGLVLVEKEARRRRLAADDLVNMILIGLAATIIAARAWFALQHLDSFLAQPRDLISLYPTALAWPEGVITGLVVAVIFAQRKKLTLWESLDVLSFGAGLMLIALNAANLAAGDGYGSVSDLPWAIELWGAARHPAQIYELLAAGAILAVLYALRNRFVCSGMLFLAWVNLAALSRLFLEIFRGDSVLISGGIRVAQVISLLILLAGMVWMQKRARGGLEGEGS